MLESGGWESAEKITERLEVATIGIGCGLGNCDGERAVITDVIGAYPWFVPPFANIRADVAGETKRAVAEYISDVTRRESQNRQD